MCRSLRGHDKADWTCVVTLEHGSATVLALKLRWPSASSQWSEHESKPGFNWIRPFLSVMHTPLIAMRLRKWDGSNVFRLSFKMCLCNKLRKKRKSPQTGREYEQKCEECLRNPHPHTHKSYLRSRYESALNSKSKWADKMAPL